MAPRQRIASPSSNRQSAEDSSASSSKTEAEPIVMSSSSTSSSSENSSTKHATSAVTDLPNGTQNGTAVLSKKQQQQQHEVIVKDRDNHDIFNLVALPIMLGSLLPNWDFGVFLKGGSLEESWNDQFMFECLFVVNLYFVLDFVWVAVVPTCVKSPGTILKHHVVAFIYLTGPILMPDFRCYMIPILSVEVNTWFLIARRVFYLRRDTVSATFRDWIDYAFNVTWIITRVVIQNWLLWRFCSLFYLRIIHGQALLIPSLFVFTQSALNIMNVKWTYDLFKPMIQRNFFPNDDKSNDAMMKTSEGTSADNNKQHTL